MAALRFTETPNATARTHPAAVSQRRAQLAFVDRYAAEMERQVLGMEAP